MFFVGVCHFFVSCLSKKKKKITNWTRQKTSGDGILGNEGGEGRDTAVGMGEGGNAICAGQEVRTEILTHFLFLLLG